MVENPAIAKPTNPLAAFFRQPKLYVTLPSHGKYYPPGVLDQSENGEYAVYAMTAKDELMFKTPDALMNGQATVELIKSCVPAIKDPWKMPSLDLDAVLIAIRTATYGEMMEVDADCPECNNRSTFEINLVSYLDKLNNFRYVDQIEVPPLTITIRPYSYQEITKASIKALEQQKVLNVVNNDSLSDEEKLEQFGESFIKLTELTVDVIAGCITSITTPEATVTDSTMIKEFINNASTDVFNTINKHVTEMKGRIDLQTQEVECTECHHQYTINLVMDQSNFFAVRS
jgi:hypothetical protein